MGNSVETVHKLIDKRLISIYTTNKMKENGVELTINDHNDKGCDSVVTINCHTHTKFVTPHS